MDIDPKDVRASVLYQQMIHCIVPRPIAWVSTMSAAGSTNLAPFSFFTGVGSRPPTLLFCPANNRQGQPKDTLRNILETREFVVNLVAESVVLQMEATSTDFPEGVSEFQACGLTERLSQRVKAPGVAESAVQFECTLRDCLRVGDGPGGANIVIGDIVHLRIDDAVIGSKGMPDPSLLKAVGRMGGAAYCRTDSGFVLAQQ